LDDRLERKILNDAVAKVKTEERKENW
jgi:hypothetical protein